MTSTSAAAGATAKKATVARIATRPAPGLRGFDTVAAGPGAALASVFRATGTFFVVMKGPSGMPEPSVLVERHVLHEVSPTLLPQFGPDEPGIVRAVLERVYMITRKVFSRGSYGSVHAAELVSRGDGRASVPVVVKIAHGRGGGKYECGTSELSIEYEGRLLASIESTLRAQRVAPQMLRLYGYGVSVPALMEHVHGRVERGTYFDYIALEKGYKAEVLFPPPSPPYYHDAGAALAGALANLLYELYALTRHGAGLRIVHLDISSSNIVAKQLPPTRALLLALGPDHGRILLPVRAAADGALVPAIIDFGIAMRLPPGATDVATPHRCGGKVKEMEGDFHSRCLASIDRRRGAPHALAPEQLLCGIVPDAVDADECVEPRIGFATDVFAATTACLALALSDDVLFYSSTLLEPYIAAAAGPDGPSMTRADTISALLDDGGAWRAPIEAWFLRDIGRTREELALIHSYEKGFNAVLAAEHEAYADRILTMAAYIMQLGSGARMLALDSPLRRTLVWRVAVAVARAVDAPEGGALWRRLAAATPDVPADVLRGSLEKLLQYDHRARIEAEEALFTLQLFEGMRRDAAAVPVPESQPRPQPPPPVVVEPPPAVPGEGPAEMELTARCHC